MSKTVCARCGQRVKWFEAWGRWKHVVNGVTGPGCGITPVEVLEVGTCKTV